MLLNRLIEFFTTLMFRLSALLEQNNVVYYRDKRRRFICWNKF